MKEYHYSVRFADSDFIYHGVFTTAFMQQKDIIAKARQALTAKLDRWDKDPKEIEFFEIYIFENEIEKQIFRYDKP